MKSAPARAHAPGLSQRAHRPSPHTPGVTVLHDVLANSLPDSFFPAPTPVSAGEGCTLQVLASIQVRAAPAAHPEDQGDTRTHRAWAAAAPPDTGRTPLWPPPRCQEHPPPAASAPPPSPPRHARAQGTTAQWRPRWLEFPELAVRADVVVRGPRADAALGHFADLLLSDIAELVDVPVYFADRLAFVDPAAERAGAWCMRPGRARCTLARAVVSVR